MGGRLGPTHIFLANGGEAWAPHITFSHMSDSSPITTGDSYPFLPRRKSRRSALTKLRRASGCTAASSSAAAHPMLVRRVHGKKLAFINPCQEAVHLSWMFRVFSFHPRDADNRHPAKQSRPARSEPTEPTRVTTTVIVAFALQMIVSTAGVLSGAMMLNGRRPSDHRLPTHPFMAVMPKDETGVSELLREQPEADGRGVRVAVLDTGCDVAAAGLQTTTDGKPKYIDIIDCTGSGDIEMKKHAKMSEDGSIEGASGRKLFLGDWASDAADADFRIGAVRLYSLLPGSARARVLRERRRIFEVEQHAAIAEAQRELDQLEGAPEKPSPASLTAPATAPVTAPRPRAPRPRAPPSASRPRKSSRRG